LAVTLGEREQTSMNQVRATKLRTRLQVWLLIALTASGPTVPAHAYSFQTHEQLVDLTWADSIQPLLLARYPGLTKAQLDEAHAYAYGGCAVQDLGYYPFGKVFFSNLTHYVRSGDFVKNLLRDAQTPNELAFAIGALSHYVGDTEGHSEAVNPSVATEFPKLAERYGPSIAYDKDPHAHVRTEFAFDINEISKHRFAPSAYLTHVGLNVPGALLRKAFFETYGLDEEKIIGKRRPVVRSYRFAVRRFLPRVSYAEVLLHHKQMPPDTPGPALDTLNASLAQTEFVKAWEPYRHHAGPGTHLMAGFIYIVPKVGPFSMLSIKGPTPETEERYIESLNRSTADMKIILQHLRTATETLPNRDLDTGQRVRPGGYRLTDETYAKLLTAITQHPDRGIPLGLKQDIEAYYSDPEAPIATKKNPAAWARVQADLVVIRSMKTRGLAMEAEENPPPDAPLVSAPGAQAPPSAQP
jgi:hypothetical protein